MNTTDSSVPNPPDIQFEKEVLLAEYKSHRDEIFKWFTYRHQAVSGYLVVLSALGTFLGTKANGDSVLKYIDWVLITLVYFSLALLYVLFQFRFAIAANSNYIIKHIGPRICELNITERLIIWDKHNQHYRKNLGKSIYLLTKLNVECIPHIMIIGVLFTLFIWALCDVCNGSVRMMDISQILKIILWIVALSLWIWIFNAYIHISKSEKNLTE